MLHQARVFSNKRLLRRIEKVMLENFAEIRNKYLSLFSEIERPAFAGQSLTPNGEDNKSISDENWLSTVSTNKSRKATDILQQTIY